MVDSQRFSYRTVQNLQGEALPRPMLPMTLVNGNRSLLALALVDTGADVNVLPYQVGIELGAIWENQPRIPSMSGNLVNAETRGILLTTVVGQFNPVQLAFAWTRTETVPLIMGQMNFFAEFDVCFFQSQSAFELRMRS